MAPACLQLKEVTDDPAMQTSPFFMKFGNQVSAMIMPNQQSKVRSMAYFILSSDKQEEANCSIKKTKSEQDDYPSIIECAVIVNHKKIDIGQEMVLYRDKPVVAAKAKTVAVSLKSAHCVEPPPKRAKQS